MLHFWSFFTKNTNTIEPSVQQKKPVKCFRSGSKHQHSFIGLALQKLFKIVKAPDGGFSEWCQKPKSGATKATDLHLGYGLTATIF